MVSSIGLPTFLGLHECAGDRGDCHVLPQKEMKEPRLKTFLSLAVKPTLLIDSPGLSRNSSKELIVAHFSF